MESNDINYDSSYDEESDTVEDEENVLNIENSNLNEHTSSDSLYQRRHKNKESLSKSLTCSDKERSRSQSPSVIQYNLFLNKNNSVEPPPTPSVADFVLLKYNLSPEKIKEKMENEFNFVIPLPKSSKFLKKNNSESSENEALMDSVTPLKFYLSTICTIGKGSFGRVFLARHRITNKYYALKTMHIPTVIAKNQVEHVHNEKQILQELNHPFIVKLYEIAKDRKNLYMILEYLSGGELFSYLRMSKRFTSPIVKFYSAEIISALEYLHSKNIAYRDLKPENLMLTKDGHIKITDLGFAKKIQKKSYTLCGTVEYLAPEIIQRKGHNHMVDYWALGILIYELMSSKTPFNGECAEEILKSMLSYENNIEFPRKTFSINAKNIINNLLKINFKKRLGYNSIEEIKQHIWFKNCNWQSIYNKEIRPPLVPTIYSEGDTGNFDSYEELEESSFCKQRELDLFDDW